MIRVAIGNFILLVSLLCGALPALAADSMVSVKARPQQVHVGEPFELEVRIRSTGLGGPGNVEVPVPKGLRQLGKRSSESVQIINGAATRERVETYTFAPLEPGEYAFRNVGVRKKRKFVPGPVVTVRAVTAARPQDQVAGADPAGQAEGAVASDGGIPLPPPDRDVFVTAHVDRDEVFVGEPVLYTFRFYFRFHPEGPTYDAPDFAGFQNYDLPQSQEPRTILAHGRSYEYYDVRALLYPLRAGELQISPAALTFRSSFFFSRQKRLETRPVTVSVKALPPGAPASFDGAVGAFKVEPFGIAAEVRESDPVPVGFRVSGVGNFGAVQAPQARRPEPWRLYPGRSSEQVQATPEGLRGTKTFEALLMPPGSGKLALPGFEFAWFDPARETYEVRALPLGTIEVKGAARSEKQVRRTPSLPLRPLRMEPGAPLADTLRPWRFLLWGAPLPFVALGLLGAGRAMRRRFGTVTAADARLAARKRLERRLGDTKAGADDVLKAVDHYLREGYSLPAAPSEEELRRCFGPDAAKLMSVRSRLQGAVFGGARVDMRQSRKLLREWLKRVGVVAGLLLLPLVPATGQAERAQPLFHEALAAHSAGEYEEAVRLYRRFAEQNGVRVNLLYNLAGAAWRAGDPGLARYAIERAYAAAPGDGDVAFNRNLIARAIAAEGGSPDSLLPGRASLKNVGWSAVAVWGLLTVLVIGAWFVPWVRWAAIAVVLISVPVVGYGGWLYMHAADTEAGVVWQNAALFESPSDEADASATTPAGDVASVTGRQAGWLKVQTGRGLTGWLKEEHWRPVPLIQQGQSVPQ